MKIKIALAVMMAMVSAASLGAEGFADRFVWVFGWGLRTDSEVAEIERVLERAGEAEFNGAVLSAGLDSLCKKDTGYFERLEAVKIACDRLGLELIPSVFSVGYGGGALSHNRNLAEGLPVRGALFRVRDKEAFFSASTDVRLRNGGFEVSEGDRLSGFNFHDAPGEITLVDREEVHGGGASLRLEHFGKDVHGHARVMQEVVVEPYRCYRVSLWVKTEGLEPVNSFRMLALAGERNLAPRTFGLEPTAGWRKLTMLFNSMEYEQVRLYAGLWEGQNGKVWLDDWSVEEVGPINVLERPGTPVTVTDEEGAVVYEAGRDFAPLRDPDFNFYRIDREAPVLRLLPGTRIRDGQRLRVSWFHPMVIHESQVTVCMAESELYRIWDHEAELLAQHLKPKRVLLNMDEVRMGGTCEACRGQDMAALLGRCVTRQTEILRRHSPGAMVYIWSDMLDPHHNAHDEYYLVEGNFSGTWNHVPKDLVIAVWGGSPRGQSVQFFADQGFAMILAGYYDAPDLESSRGWLELARRYSGVRGMMYTTWQRRYEFLPGFGDLLR